MVWKTSEWKPAECPVCKTELGYRRSGEMFTYLCDECQFWFTWDLKGKLLKPQNNCTKEKKGCNCASCQYRDSKK